MAHLPWSPFNPNKCEPCRGVGMVVIHVPSAVYDCGFITRAVTCPKCLGTGRDMPVSIALDGKLAAAGDVQ